MSGDCPDHLAECSCHQAIQLLQEKWVLHIVRALLPGPRGFNEVGREAGGCNPSTLAQRLARLEAVGLVRKHVDADGNRSTYELTEAGEDLRDVVHAIDAWASRHLAGPALRGIRLDDPGAAPPLGRNGASRTPSLQAGTVARAAGATAGVARHEAVAAGSASGDGAAGENL